MRGHYRLQPGRRPQRKAATAAPAGAGASDDFNRADSDSVTQLGANWFLSSSLSWPYMTIVSNEAQGTNSSWPNNFLWHDPATSTNQYVEVDVYTSQGEGGIAICSTGSPTAFSGYLMRWFNWAGSVYIFKNETEVASFGGHNQSAAWVRMRLERVGNVISVYEDAVLKGSYTDSSSQLTGLYFGLCPMNQNLGPMRYDNFVGGDL